MPFADSSLRRASAFDPLRDAIESLVDGTLQPSTTSDLCESFLHEHALRSELVTAARDLCSMLEQAGCTSYLQYCTSSEFRHPVPVIIALDSEGNFVLPNVNCVWNPTIPEERDAKGSDSHKKQVIAPEELEYAEGMKKVVLLLERFPETAPVYVALLPHPQQQHLPMRTPFLAHKPFRRRSSTPLQRKHHAATPGGQSRFDHS